MSPPIPPPDQGTTWVDKFGRVRISTQEFHDDDGNIVYGQDAIQAGCAWIDDIQEHNRRVLSSRPLRVVAIIKPRTTRTIGGRESHSTRPGHRRTRTTQARASSDDDGPAEASAESDLRHISGPLADELDRIADRLRARGGIG